jgi:glycosyltransferase involved in cell wall biosynthesis
MRVSHVLKTTGLSGAEAHLLALSAALGAEGIESHLLVLVDEWRPPTVVIAAARELGVAIETVPLKGDVDPGALPKLVKRLKAARTQIVHTHLIHGDLYGTLAARRAGVTVVQTRHNDDAFRRRWPVKLLTRALAGQAQTVIAISNGLAAFVRDVEGVPASKVVAIHYGLDPASVAGKARPGALRAELGLSERAPLVGAVGRLTAQKGFRFLLEALARMDSDAHLAIAGEGELRATLKAQAVELGLRDRVHFLGWRSDTPTVMADLDVLAVPSLWEGFGLVTLEAMAMRKPIVASNVSALPEIVADGENGWLVPPADPAALAAALAKVLADPTRARALGACGRARLEKEFTVQRMARRHAIVYTEAASRVPEFTA